MKILRSLIFFMFFVLTKADAQLVKVFESDSLNIYTKNNGETSQSSSCQLKFVSEINDSIKVYVDNKLLFSKFVQPDSTVISDRVDPTAPYIDLPIKNKNPELKLLFLNEELVVRSIIIKGYKYLYVYKDNKTINLVYENEKLLFY